MTLEATMLRRIMGKRLCLRKARQARSRHLPSPTPEVSKRKRKATACILIPTREFDWRSCRLKRGGVIPYTVFDNRLYFGLGVDSKSNEYSDFGGTVEQKDCCLLGAINREFAEESLNSFKNYNTEEALMEGTALIGDIAVIFLRVDKKYIMVAEETFEEKKESIAKCSVKDQKHLEMSSINWIDTLQYKSLVYSRRPTRMYDRLKETLSRVDFKTLVGILLKQ